MSKKSSIEKPADNALSSDENLSNGELSLADEQWITESLRDHLDAQSNNLDFNVTSKLSAARHRALAQETNTSTVGSFISWFSWKTAVASTAVVALTIFATQQFYQTNPEPAIGVNDSIAANQVPQQVLIEDLELLTASDDIDFYQSVEFLEWMAINSG